jgi:hypothetical protein
VAESSLSLTFTDLANCVGPVFGYGATYSAMSATEQEQVSVAIRRGLRMFYFPEPLEPGKAAHKWTFLHPQTTLTSNAPYSTGTITVVDGVVTLASGTFPSWAASGLLSVSGTLYDVSSRDSGTQVTLVDTTLDVAAGTSYGLYQGNADAPDAFGGFDDRPTYVSPSSRNDSLVIVDESEIRRLRAQTTGGYGRPLVVAARVINATATSGQRWEFMFWPAFDAAYVLSYTFHYLPDMISSTQYPLGGMSHAETILACCMFAAAQMVSDQEQIQRRERHYKERMAASISHDRSRMSPERILTHRELREGYDGRFARGPRALTGNYEPS